MLKACAMTSTARRAPTAGAILALAVAAAGCGGGDDTGGGPSFAEGGLPHDTPTSAEVVGCLKTAGRKAGFTVSESAADLDSIARQAGDRAVALDAGGGRSAMVIFERTEQQAGTIIDRYRAGPIDERGSAYAQSGTIVIVDKGFGLPSPKPMLDCTKYGTKEQGGGSAATRSTSRSPIPRLRGRHGRRGPDAAGVRHLRGAEVGRPPLGASDTVELRLG